MWWDGFVATQLLQNRPRSIREVENAARLYLRLMVHARPETATLGEIPFADTVLLKAWSEAQWAAPTAAEPARGASAPVEG
ncbi:hypothetical protein [Roseisolibacter agri]|uniref:Uncharacterized protein n=1 Tax=Roseisolibacter agri TaxID=2014610 RepID=A0AA37VD10_9BACT|nr:hypothetical protein [Roseisolibacter agri]GLC28288.1 hypothetical protein rosag_48010 [Roseisolibacter agri]